ncbi:ABC transporter ATP-binding protein [Nocardioides pacificus]
MPSTPLALVWRMLRRNWRRLSVFMVLLALWQLCETLVPVVIGLLIDRAVATSDAGELALWGSVLVGLFVVLSLSWRYGARLGVGVMERETHAMRVETAGRALDPRGTSSTLLPGETLSLATSDAEAVGQLVNSVGYTLASLMAILVSAWVLIGIDLQLGLVVLIGVPVVLAIIQVVTPTISRRSHQQQETVARATGVATDLVRGLRVLKGIGAEDVAGRRYRVHSAAARDASIRTADSYGVMTGLSTGLSTLFLALVALLAGRLAVEGDITIGELVAIVGLTQFLAEPISALGEVGAHAGRAYASARRIVAYLDSPPLLGAGDRTPDSGDPRGLRLRDVTSRPGELLGLVTDPSDAALAMRILSGEVHPDEHGSALLDGVPLDELDVDARRSRLVVAPHHPDLFEGTLRSNVAPPHGCDAATLDRALAASAATDVAALREEGVDQPVSAQGSTLSGGQRQRVALARALAADAPVLVLHDPTTAVDAVTEHRIAAGIRELRHGAGSDRTTWLLTTSPALLAQADRVVVLRDGRVAASGTHAELSGDPTYRELVLR